MKKTFKSIIKEPLFHFLVIGMVIFLVSGYMIREKQNYTIVLDKNTIGKLSLAWKTQYGNLPNQRELKIISDEYVRQEILVREAKALGLDADDEIIRRRLVQKMEFLEKDNIIIDEPTNEEIEEYFLKNKSKFEKPTNVTFTHIYFSPDVEGSDAARTKAIQVLDSLNSNPSIKRAPELGDRFSLLYDYADVDKTQAVSLLGNSEISDSLFTANAETWSGPFRSGYGWHLVYLNGKSKSEIPEFSLIKDKVTESYKSEMLETMNAKAFEELFDKYTIEVEIE